MKQRSRAERRNRTPKSDFVEIKSPFGGLSEDERSKTLDTLGENARAKYEETTTELIALLAANDPIHILACMGWRFFTALAQDGSADRWPAAHQHHLEILQALSLRGLRGEANTRARLATTVQRVIDLLDINTTAFNWSRLSGRLAGQPESRLRNVQEQIRGNTQFVRGEFHPHQLDRYLRAILGRIDAEFERVYGVTGTTTLSILQRLLSLVENKLNLHMSRLRRVMRNYKPAKAIKEYIKVFPSEEAHKDQIIAASIIKQVGPDMMRFFLFEEADKFLPDVLGFTADEIATACAKPSIEKAVIRILDAWSLSFNDLKDHPIEFLYLANPVWDRPLIKLGDNKYFWSCPGSSISFGFEMFERLLVVDSSLLKAYENARAVVLEDELAVLLTKYFPNGRVLREVQWTSPVDGKRYENDAVVIIDRTALLFEAKSGSVSPEARRGADRRLMREAQKLIVDPAEQSMRLLQLLESQRQEHHFLTKAGVEIIDSREVDTFIRISVTFNVIGPLFSRWHDLVDAGLIGDATNLVPTMSIADLDTICDLLRNQATITHYLRRRASFERNADYLADEYDLVAFYMKTGFNIGETEFNGTPLMIYGMSERLNAFYKRQAHDANPTRPLPELSKLFFRLITALEQRRPPRWLEITNRLLNVAVTDQKTIEQNTKASIAEIKKSREPDMSWAGQLANGPPQRREAIAVVWFRCRTLQTRNERLRNHALQTMDMAGTSDCLVLGFDVTRPSDPYSVIGIFSNTSAA